MKVLFDKEYLGNLYEKGNSGDKKHRFQPQVEVIATICNITDLSNHYQ